jgi:hypothetical protein
MGGFSRGTFTVVSYRRFYQPTFDTSTIPAVFELPFDYPSLVQWSPGTFEVAITAVIESFYHYLEMHGN